MEETENIWHWFVTMVYWRRPKVDQYIAPYGKPGYTTIGSLRNFGWDYMEE